MTLFQKDNKNRYYVLPSDTADQCTMTHFGMVHSFDGYNQVAKADLLTVLAESTGLEIDDPCYFMARVCMDVQVSYQLC